MVLWCPRQQNSGRGFVASVGGAFASFQSIHYPIQTQFSEIKVRPDSFFVNERVCIFPPALMLSSERG